MKIKLEISKCAALLGLLAVFTSAQASVDVFTDESQFSAAVTHTGTETFFGIDQGSLSASPLKRRTQIGTTYHYQIGDQSGFVGAGSDSQTWLTANDNSDVMTFSHFAENVSAFGGNFFGVDFNGLPQAGTVFLSVTDASGATFVEELTDPDGNSASFLGFVSHGSSIVSVELYSAPLESGDAHWAAAGNVVFGQAAPIPEPATLPLMAVGCALLGLLRRRSGFTALR